MTKKDAENVDNTGRFWGSILAGALLGVAVGGSIALLFAPKSGRELRGDIEDAADTVKQRAEVTLDDLQETALRLAQTSRSLIDETRENLIRSVEAGKEAYSQKRSEMLNDLENKLRREPEDEEISGSGV